MTRIFGMFRTAPAVQLGPLERQLLDVLWQRGNATVREILDEQGIQLAYTTVMTTLDRLYKKQVLDRVAEGRAFRYTPRYSAEDLQRATAGHAIRQLLGSNDPAAMPLSYLVEAVEEHDAQLLDELQMLVERKRRELKNKEKH